MNITEDKRTSLIIALLLTLVVGYIDFITGIEIRIFPLYFLPITLAAWSGGKQGAVTFSILSTCLWALCMYAGGRIYSHNYIWLINFFTQGSVFLIVSLLVARLHDALKQEKLLSRTDALTLLNNARAFHESAETLTHFCHRKKQPVVVAYIDLDNFKQVNDTHGHKAGDCVLQAAADVFRTALRQSDIAARLGGDEFIVYLPDTTAEDGQTALQKLHNQLINQTLLKQYNVTASIGAIAYQITPAELKLIIQTADQLMYDVKKSGKNKVNMALR